MIERVITLLLGATGFGCFAIAAYFFRFGREARERLFKIFGLAFVALGANAWLVAALAPQSESRPWFYLLRLAAFILIIAAIIDKNRRE